MSGQSKDEVKGTQLGVWRPQLVEVERLPPRHQAYGGLFELSDERDDGVLEPCDRCKGYHTEGVLTVCALLRAKELVMRM